MQKLAYAFWNRQEHRPRAGWRLLLYVVVLAVILLILMLIGRVLPTLPYLEPIAERVPWPVMILSAWLAGRLFDRRRFADFGMHLGRDWWLDCGFGLVLGVVLIAGISAAGVTAGWLGVRLTPDLDAANAPLALALFIGFLEYVVVAAGEELMSRGYQFRNLAEGFNGRCVGARGALVISALLTSATFAALHLPDPNTSVLSAANTLLSGILLAVTLVYTGRLGLAIGLHVTWNFAQGCLFGFPVSGGAAGVALCTIADHGPALWTGGQYGPEGGLLGTAAIVAGIILTLTWTRLRYGPLRLDTSLAEYHPRVRRVLDAGNHTA